MVDEGQRIGKKFIVAKTAGISISSPSSGKVSYFIDGCELIGDPFERSDFSFVEVKAGYQEKNLKGQLEFQKNDILLKIVDNLEKPKIYLEVPLEIFSKPLQIGTILRIKFPEDDSIYSLKISKLKGIGKDAIMDLEFVNSPEKYSRIQELKIIFTEKEAVKIPRKSIIDKDGSLGIFSVEKGFVKFIGIEPLAEDEEYILTDSVAPLTEVIINPRFAKEGKYIR